MKGVAAALVLLVLVVGVAAAWPLWVGLMDLAVVEANRSEPGAIPPSGAIEVGLGGQGCGVVTPATTFHRTDRIHWIARYDYVVVGDRPAHVELTHDGKLLAGYPRDLTIWAYARCLNGGTLPQLDAGEYTLTIKVDYVPPSTATFVVR